MSPRRHDFFISFSLIFSKDCAIEDINAKRSYFINFCPHDSFEKKFLNINIVLALTYVSTKQRSNAPHTPRIILLGPVGSGKSVQAALLESKYQIVNGKIFFTLRIFFEDIHLCIS